jgi:hypothetical protein
MKVSALPFFNHGNIFIPKVEKVPVVRHSAFPNSNLQLLDESLKVARIAKLREHYRNGNHALFFSLSKIGNSFAYAPF